VTVGPSFPPAAHPRQTAVVGGERRFYGAEAAHQGAELSGAKTDIELGIAQVGLRAQPECPRVELGGGRQKLQDPDRTPRGHCVGDEAALLASDTGNQPGVEPGLTGGRRHHPLPTER